MKKIISLVLTLAMLLGACAVLGSCGAPDDPGAKIAIYLGEEVYDFDPSDYYVSDNAAQFLSLVYEPLFRLDDDGDLKKALADDYEIDKDERTITIELRETYWSDDVRVTADDFIFAWRDVILNPRNANPAAALLYDIENAVNVKNGAVGLYNLGVTKLNAYCLEIKYREGADPKALLKNLASVATSPVRQDKYENSNGFWSKRPDTMTFNGPFKVVELDFENTVNSSFKLTRNLGYHQAPDEVDYDNEVRPYKLYSFYNPNGNTIGLTYDQIENNTIFFAADAPLATRAASVKKAEVANTFSTYTYVFNTENPLFRIKEVRQALSYAIDRNAIINLITFGEAATGFVPSSIDDAATRKSFRKKNEIISAGANLGQAQALMASVADKTASLDKTVVLSVNDDEESVAIANYIKGEWEKLGLTVIVEPLGGISSLVTENEIKVYDSVLQYIVKSKALGTASEYDPAFTPADRIKDGAVAYSNFDVVAVDWQFYTNDAFVGLAALATPFNGLGTDPDTFEQRLGITGWDNGAYNSYITAAYKATDKDARSEALRSAEKVLIDEMPVIPLVFNQNFYLKSKALKKIDVDGFGNVILKDAKLKKYEKYLEDARFAS